MKIEFTKTVSTLFVSQIYGCIETVLSFLNSQTSQAINLSKKQTCPLCIKFFIQPLNPSLNILLGYFDRGFDRPPSCSGPLTVNSRPSPGVSPTASQARRSSTDEVRSLSVSATVAASHRSTTRRTCCIQTTNELQFLRRS